MRILFIGDLVPYPILGGASLRNYNILRRLASEHEVWLVGFAKNEEQMSGVQQMKRFCHAVQVVEAPDRRALSDLRNYANYIFKGIPPELRYFASAALTQNIQKALSQVPFDVIHIDQIYMGLYLEKIPSVYQQRALWCLHDIDFVKYERIIQLEPEKTRKIRLWINNQFMYRWEPLHAAKFKRCITVSEIDRRLLMEKNPRLKIDVIPNGVDTHSFTSLPDEQRSPTLIFVGNMTYLPCIDAVQYFCSQILPIIREAVPGVEFWVVGRDPPEQILKLNGDGVHITGRAEDVRPYYEQSTVCVVPLRAGGGTRLKILEAIALGRPVISTSIGCEGLDLRDNEHILIADDPSSFAQKTIRLLTDKPFRNQLCLNGRQVVEILYDWDVITMKLVKVYQELAAS